MAGLSRSAALQIVRPPVEGRVPAPPVEQEKKRDTTQRLCRNVLIYGSCRFQDHGCIYYHPPAGAEVAGLTTPTAEGYAALPTINQPTPDLKDSKSSVTELGAEHLSAPVFVPKVPMAEGVSPRPSTPSVATTAEAMWSHSSNNGGYIGHDTISDSSMGQHMAYDDQYLDMSQQGMDSGMYMNAQPMRQTLDYHLYTSPLPHVSQPPLTTHSLHSFFVPDDLRRTLQARHDAIYATPPPSTGLPAELGVYHSLFPLEGASIPSKVYGHPAPVYRGTSTVDGNVYSLRRIEGFRLANEAAFSAVDTWRRMRHPNIVSLREAFTTKSFNDNSLMLVYDYHPNSATVWEEHLTGAAEGPILFNGRKRQGMPIPERLLWSYITQMANALKAIHSSGLAARNLDPSKVLITGKNRVRLNGCGILDVLAYDASTPVSHFQQEDLVSFGKLVISMACEFFQPGQHPAGPLDHIARNYSPDVKSLVLFLISKPQPIKTIDDVIRMLGPRILNEMDAMQSYNDVLETELGGEIENGRIARLLMKLGFVNERAEFELDPRWSDTGDRYILKLFRDHVFHSIDQTGAPVLDLSHVLTCLNKLDAGLDEKIMLVSRDDQSCLVVSYREINTCVESAYNELRNAVVVRGGSVMGR